MNLIMIQQGIERLICFKIISSLRYHGRIQYEEMVELAVFVGDEKLYVFVATDMATDQIDSWRTSK